MMHITSLLLCSSSNSAFLSPISHHSFQPPFGNHFSSSASFSSLLLRFHCHRRCSATQEIVETSTSGSDLVEVGYLSSVHGLQGEICVKSATDFPELRFSKPGRRWLKQQVLGNEIIREVELIEGREHPAHKCWILTFHGIDTVDQAKPLVGSALLVRDGDRPELDEDEFYTRDLVGMSVILKENNEFVGTVVNVFNSGASDLLHVKLHSFVNVPDGSRKADSVESEVYDHLVWVSIC